MLHAISENTIDESIVTIHAGKLLDFSISPQVFRACDSAKKSTIKIILVDLAQTSQVMNSGLAMLDILHDRTECLVQVINFVNYKPTIRKFLMEEYFNCSSRELVR